MNPRVRDMADATRSIALGHFTRRHDPPRPAFPFFDPDPKGKARRAIKRALEFRDYVREHGNSHVES